MDIDQLVAKFADGRLAIDYSEASNDQMIQLEQILNERTDFRPHDNMTYSKHMMHYVRRGFCFLTCSDTCAASYGNEVINCRPTIIPIEKVLELAGVNTTSDQISESEFESMF